MTFFPDSRPLVIAHRGFAVDVPENTLAAFQAGLDAGADIIETDVHLSRDGEVIIAHDPTLDRVAGISGRVSDFTAKDLATINLGQGHGFPTLAEALETLPHTRFNIDLKTPEVADPFIDVIKQMTAQDRVLVASFDEATRARAVRNLPGVATSATRKHVFPGLVWSALGATASLSQVFDGIDAIQAPTRYLGIPIASPRFIQQLRSIDKHVHVWTINEEAQMRDLYRAGVTGIVSDRADIAARVRAEFLP